jgi:hypothetical protein
MQTQSRIVLLNTSGLNFVENKRDYDEVIEVLNDDFEVGLHYI